jgi:hypothetical protein
MSDTSTTTDLIDVMNNLNVNDTIVTNIVTSDTSMNYNIDNNVHDNKKETSHLFITYSKNKRIEFQSCKPYDPEEIYFNHNVNYSVCSNEDIIETEDSSQYINKDDDTIMMF